MPRRKYGLIFCLLLPPLCWAQRAGIAASPSVQIGRIMQARFAAGDFNGAALVARQGKVLYQHAFGLANREWDIPNDLKTKFEIGSMTKQFTAMLILQMVNQGKLRLDGHVTDYLPYYRQDTGKRITIAELLSHTAGVPNFTDMPGFLEGPESRAHYENERFRSKILQR